MVRRSKRAKRGAVQGAMGSSGLTPLLDTLFLLLFALLASSDSASVEVTEPEEEVQVELPSVDPVESGSGNEADAARIFLRIDADDSVVVVRPDGPRTTATAGELRAELTEAIGPDGAAEEAIVEIRADANARHGVTVDVLQTVRAVGIVDVRFVATAGPEDGNDLRPLGGAPEGSTGGSRGGPR
ncbi:MAG: biopolymer transporter ExbD [Planctomycetota bacterium]